MGEPVVCPVCGLAAAGHSALARHMVELAETSDGHHIMWLNRNVTMHRTSPVELEPLLAVALAGRSTPGERLDR